MDDPYDEAVRKRPTGCGSCSPRSQSWATEQMAQTGVTQSGHG